jgi:hypothetical protein
LKKSLYGLRDAPLLWNKHIDLYLRSLGFKPLVHDPCFYFFNTGSSVVILLLYVDDIIIGSTDRSRVTYLEQELSQKFRITSKPLEKYLNIRIRHYKSKHEVHMDLSDYIGKLFQRFNLKPKTGVKTPMQENLQLLREEEMSEEEYAFVDGFPYQEMLGAALYICVCMMPTIAYSVHVLARFSKSPTKAACHALERLFHFLYNVRDCALVLGGPPGGVPQLACYSDSDWATDPATRNSMIGVLIFVGFGCVEWHCSLQKHPALSSAEAEFVNLTHACKMVEYYRHMLTNLGFELKYATTIWCDNLAAINISKVAVHSKRTKHIAVKYFKIRLVQECGVIVVDYVNTSENCADIFTKPLGSNLFSKFSHLIMDGILPPISSKKVETRDLDSIY